MSDKPNISIRDLIAAANETFMAAFKAGNAAAVADLYTEEGKVLPPNSDVVTGRQAIHAFWQGLLDMGIKQAKLEISEVERCGNTAYEVSKFSLFGAGGQVLEQGKYIVIWKKVGDQWKLHRDIFNSSLPLK